MSLGRKAVEGGGRGRAALRRRRFGVLLAAIVVSSGCYSYVPSRPGDVATLPGDEVRVYLTEAGTTDLARFFGPRVASVDAQFIRMGTDSTLVLGVTRTRMLNGVEMPFDGNGPMEVATSLVASVERRTLARKRTVVATSGAVASAVALAAAALKAGRFGGGGGRPIPPTPP
jgi:hypothetical protein